MLETIAEFETRASEVEAYCKMIATFDEEGVTVVQGPDELFEVDRDLFKTLKATAYLLFYNLVESTMRNAIQAIFDELRERRVPYVETRLELKRIALRNLKNLSLHDAEACNRVSDISVDIFEAGFSRNDLFSGNLDARAIRDTADEYGFSHWTDHAMTRGGVVLYTVKTNRNDLAHGFKTFSEVGRGITARELKEDQERIVAYLRQILLNVKTYIDDQAYLEAVEA